MVLIFPCGAFYVADGLLREGSDYGPLLIYNLVLSSHLAQIILFCLALRLKFDLSIQITDPPLNLNGADTHLLTYFQFFSLHPGLQPSVSSQCKAAVNQPITIQSVSHLSLDFRQFGLRFNGLPKAKANSGLVSLPVVSNGHS